MATNFILFFMATAMVVLRVCEEHENEKSGHRKTIFDKLWTMIVFATWIVMLVWLMLEGIYC
jgi:hypothetical protein